jgi:hypothetical protein
MNLEYQSLKISLTRKVCHEIIGQVHGHGVLQDKVFPEGFLGMPGRSASVGALLPAYPQVWRYVFLQASGTEHVCPCGQGEGVAEMSCEYSVCCIFMEHMSKSDPLTAYTVKITYCDHDKYGCARYGLFEAVGADSVPDFLWPNNEEEALEVIKIKKRSKNLDENFLGNEDR